MRSNVAPPFVQDSASLRWRLHAPAQAPESSVSSSDLCAREGAVQSKDTAGRKVKGVDSVDSEAGWRQ